MKNEIILTICERYRENIETVRITGHTEDGKEHTFRVLGENAWWFESFLKKDTQIVLCPVETYVVYSGTQEDQTRIPFENSIRVEKSSSE